MSYVRGSSLVVDHLRRLRSWPGRDRFLEIVFVNKFRPRSQTRQRRSWYPPQCDLSDNRECVCRRTALTKHKQHIIGASRVSDLLKRA